MESEAREKAEMVKSSSHHTRHTHRAPPLLLLFELTAHAALPSARASFFACVCAAALGDEAGIRKASRGCGPGALPPIAPIVARCLRTPSLKTGTPQDWYSDGRRSCIFLRHADSNVGREFGWAARSLRRQAVVGRGARARPYYAPAQHPSHTSRDPGLRSWHETTHPLPDARSHMLHAPCFILAAQVRGVLRQLSCGGAHTAALTDDGQVRQLPSHASP